MGSIGLCRQNQRSIRIVENRFKICKGRSLEWPFLFGVT